MVVYECIYQQCVKTREECEICFFAGMNKKYLTRAYCIQQNAEKIEGEHF